MWKHKMGNLMLYTLLGAAVSLAALEVRAGGVEASAPKSIAPTGKGGAGKAGLRTPAMMAEDAMYMLQPLNEEKNPFMPTEEGYWFKKANANAQSEAALSAGLDTFSGRTQSSAQGAAGLLAPPVIKGVNFEGASQSGSYPPDTHGAVGPSHVVEVVNTRVVVYSKAGALLKTTALNTFFGSTEFLFDPRVVYDQTWNRWVVIATRRTSSTTDPVRRFFLAVSRTGDPTGSYFVYNNIQYGGGGLNDGDWFDYPALGMDQDAVLVTANVFDVPAGGFKFAIMIPIAKARIYNGLGFSGPAFTGLLATLQPPIVFDQNKDAYFVAANNLTHLHLYRGENLSNAFEASLVLQAAIDVPDYAVPPDAPQLGTTQLLDTLDRRFVNASTQVSDSLWNVHTINAGGFATPKFYQIDTEGAGINTLKQSGFFFENGPSSHDFNASIAVNASGEAFVTWNTTDVANSTVASRHNARIRISGRQPADALGVIPAGSSVFTSSALNPLTGNTSSTAGIQRWGDYSAVSLDPSPGTTAGCGANRRAWIINEKVNAAATWGSRIARIGFCD